MLSKRHQAWLDVATKLALDSTCRNQHGALIVLRGSVLGVGVNRFRNHPQFVHDYEHCSRHAEMVALRSVIKRSEWVDLRKAVVYVARARLLDTGEVAKKLSRPCDACWQALKQAGVRRAVFTTDDGAAFEAWD